MSGAGHAAPPASARRWRRALWALALLPLLGIVTQGFLFPGRTEWPAVPRQLHAPVILITVPGLRADRLGHLGYTLPAGRTIPVAGDPARRGTAGDPPTAEAPPGTLTPTLDTLARHGVSFTGAYAVSNASRTTAATLVSGVCPQITGVHGPDDRLPGAARTMAEVLAARGYHCIAILGDPDLADAGLEQGFDVFITAAPGEDADGLLTAGLAAYRASTNPNVFLWIDLPDLRRPYGGRDLDLSAWAPDAPADFGTAPELLGDLDPARLVELGWGPRQMAWMDTRYDAALHELDAAVGRFVAGLADDFVLEILTLAVTGTRGERLGERAGPAFTHATDLYEGSVRVPFLLRLPARHVRSLRLERLASSEDVAPTLLELGGRVTQPTQALTGCTGVSLAPDITRLDESRDRVPFAGRHGGADGAALVARAGTGLYKLIRSTDADGGPRRELYLLDSDPGEWQDIAASRPLHADKLAEWLDTWIDDCSRP